MEKEKISILLASYNGSKYIVEQINSILLQTYTNFELLICDDCSSDNTFEILEKYSQKDSRIRIYCNEQNLGFKKNFERLLELASCDYIALSDQDDIWTNDHLERLITNIEEKDLICGNAFLADENGNPLGNTLLDCSNFDFLPNNQDEWFRFLLHGSIFQGAACLFKRQLIQYIVPIPDTVRFHDYWITLQAVLNGGLIYLNEPILYYRQHGNNVTNNNNWNYLDKIKQSFDIRYSRNKNIEQLDFLKAVLSCKINEEQRKKVLESIKFYKRKKNIHRLLNISYFISNYKWMYLSNNKKLYILRFIKNIFMWN